MLDDVELIVSELVTNGVLHARTPLGVTISIESGVLEIAVSDSSDAVPVTRPQRDDLARDLETVLAVAPSQHSRDDRDPALDVGEAGSVVGGRGLQLVTALAADWGTNAHRPGKAVWARLPIPHEPLPAFPCPCPTGSTRLASGHPVAVNERQCLPAALNPTQ